MINTKLLFRYDPKANLNFHHFVDFKENLLIVIRLANNITVGGFSLYPLEKIDKEQAKKLGIGKGFIFNLTY